MLTSKTRDAPATTVWAVISAQMRRRSRRLPIVRNPATVSRQMPSCGSASPPPGSTSATRARSGTRSPTRNAADATNVSALTR